MATDRSLQLPGEEYSQDEERRFRRELEEYLYSLSSEIAEAKSRKGTESSLASKRDAIELLRPEVSSFGATGSEIAYGSFNKTASGWTDTVTKNGYTWMGPDTTWTRNSYSDWEEVGAATGTFQYTGSFPKSGSRTFFLSAAMNAWYWLTMPYTSIGLRVQKSTNSGVDWSDVAGSEQMSAWDHYLIYLGSYLYSQQVSTSCMFDLSSGDLIRIQRGYFISGAATGTVTATFYQTFGDGIIFNVFGVD